MEIREKIDELRELFRELYGVDAIIEIRLHKHRNQHVSRELMNYISHELANMVEPEEIQDNYNCQSEGFNWVTLKTRAGFEYTGFY